MSFKERISLFTISYYIEAFNTKLWPFFKHATSNSADILKVVGLCDSSCRITADHWSPYSTEF